MEEVWKPIAGYEGIYDVSDQGDVYSYRAKRNRKLEKHHRDGRYYVDLFKDGTRWKVAVHRLVALTFHLDTYADGLEASHVNGLKTDNRALNLVWESHLSNISRMEEHGTMPRGEKHGNARLTWNDVIEMRTSHLTPAQAAKKYSISRSHARRILRHERWTESLDTTRSVKR